MVEAARLGTAGWSIPTAVAEHFPGDGSHLERYARQLTAVEINSSFHRRHRPATYARWASAVPRDFCFSAKAPKAITHARRLIDTSEPLDAFAYEVGGLGDKLKVILVQLPPSLEFIEGVAATFFEALQKRIAAMVACEPRHASWFTPEVDQFLAARQVARVAAHPVLAAAGERPGGWQRLNYHRLHGAPRLYHSTYGPRFLAELVAPLRATVEGPVERWCIFDNTASGAAAGDALALRSLLEPPGSSKTTAGCSG